jgi:hypothetical protein
MPFITPLNNESIRCTKIIQEAAEVGDTNIAFSWRSLF